MEKKDVKADNITSGRRFQALENIESVPTFKKKKSLDNLNGPCNNEKTQVTKLVCQLINENVGELIH